MSIQKWLGQLDWRAFLALTITFVWLGAGSFYLSEKIGWIGFFNQPLDSLGGFLEGAFAPLAFLWLVVGFFLQQKELSKNTEAIQLQHVEMQKSAEQAALQANSIQASALHSQQQSFIRTYEMVRSTLGSVVGMLYMSSQGPINDGEIDTEESRRLWAEMVNGDSELFTRRFLYMNAAGKEDIQDLLFGTEIRTSHTNNFVRQFKRILEGVEHCDPDGMLNDAIRDSANGRFYKVIVKLKKKMAQH